MRLPAPYRTLVPTHTSDLDKGHRCRLHSRTIHRVDTTTIMCITITYITTTTTLAQHLHPPPSHHRQFRRCTHTMHHVSHLHVT